MSTYINPFLSSFALQYLEGGMIELKKDKFSYIRDLSGVAPIKVTKIISKAWLTDQTMLVQCPCKFNHL